MTFRQSVLAAAEQAVATGEIDRTQLVMLRFATARPAKLRRLQRECCDELQSRGQMPAAGEGAIDWSQLLAFLRELLPIILMFLNGPTLE